MVVHATWLCLVSKAEAAGKTEFLTVPNGFTLIDRHFGEEPWDQRTSGTSQKWIEMVQNSKASCFTLLKRITNSKMSIQKSGQSTVTLNRVASIGPMAPCRSHHRNRTRQERIFEKIRQELNPVMSPVTCKPAVRKRMKKAGT